MFLFTWQALFRVSDVGMNVILAFIATFLAFLSRSLGFPPPVQEFVHQLPKTVYLARKYIGGSSPKCHSIYPIDNCKIVMPNKSIVSSKCSYVVFPNHPHRTRRNPCDMVLMKTVRTSCGTSSLYPKQMYCYESLQELILHPGFVEMCETYMMVKYGKSF